MTDGLPGVPFVKMEGAGNDFVVLLAPETLAPGAGAIAALCDRRRGVGADGVLLLRRLDDGCVAVIYRNRDGSEAFCGNGMRCAAAHAVAAGLAPASLTLESGGTRLAARVRAAGADAFDVDVEMPAPGPERREIALEGARGVLVVVGVPHLVVPVERVDAVDLAQLGPLWRRLPALGPGGANVNVVEGSGRTLALRTWERGVEAETLACGSGAVAAAIVCGDPVGETELRVRSGDVLRVRQDEGATWLSGPARTSFRGHVSPRIWSRR